MRFREIVCAAAGLLGCWLAVPSSAAGEASRQLHVVATTTLLASLAAEVGRGRADVSSLVPVGASPETYQPAPSDIARLHDAGLVIQNGAGLDAWLDRLLNTAGGRIPLVRCTDGLPVVDGNPHLWLDPVLARGYVARMRDGMIAADPAGAAVYRRNAAAADARMRALETTIRNQLAAIPPARREMIVFHNAWFYYDRRFGLQTLGVIEEYPGTEPSAQHLAQLVDLARSHHVRAIFAEPEYSAKLVQAVARSAQIEHVAVLYDDSVAAGAANDYEGMLLADTRTIVDALK